jgi:phage terminase large subunit-like protein
VRPYFFMPADNVTVREDQDRVPYSRWCREVLITPTPGNVVDYSFVLGAIRDLAAQYSVAEIALDPYGAALLSQQIQELGLTPLRFGQTPGWLDSPTRELQRLVLGSQVRHDGNEVLRWNVECHATEQDSDGRLKIVKPDRRRNYRRIDGLVATVMGLDRAMRRSPVAADQERDVTVLFL